MTISSVFFFCVFLFGIAGMTVAPPLIARGLVFVRRLFRAAPPETCGRMSSELTRDSLQAPINAALEVLIPVHNQAEDLAATLASLRNAGHAGRIVVGANACTDHSEQVAESFGAVVLKRREPGKFPMMLDLAHAARAEWVGFVDAGTLFTPETLRGLELASAPAKTVAIAPRYKPSRAGLLSNLHWSFEAFLKRLENAVGGPIAIHGAAVFYRREPLLETLATLEHRSWVNDDVVIPLALRAHDPEFRIDYRSHLTVDDHGAVKPSPGRRRRLVRGNLQWIFSLRELGVTNSPVLLLLASRRVFRLFAAWWLTFAALAALQALAAWNPIAGFVGLFNSLALLVFLRKTELLSTFTASLFFFREMNGAAEEATAPVFLNW